MKKIMFLADLIVLAAFGFGLYGCVKAIERPRIAPIDPNVIVLTPSETAIVRAVNAKFRQVDDRMAVIEQILRGDPNNAL
jgi:Skp family chaperone for outer membrane proteins